MDSREGFDTPMSQMPQDPLGDRIRQLHSEERITRKRLLELNQIAYELCAWLDTKQVRKHESCIIKRYAEEFWSAKND